MSVIPSLFQLSAIKLNTMINNDLFLKGIVGSDVYEKFKKTPRHTYTSSKTTLYFKIEKDSSTLAGESIVKKNRKSYVMPCFTITNKDDITLLTEAASRGKVIDALIIDNVRYPRPAKKRKIRVRLE